MVRLSTDLLSFFNDFSVVFHGCSVKNTLVIPGWDGKRREVTVGIVSGETAAEEHTVGGSVLLRVTWEPVDFKKPPPLPSQRKRMNLLMDLDPAREAVGAEADPLALPAKLTPPPDLELAMPPRPVPERSGTPPRGG